MGTNESVIANNSEKCTFSESLVKKANQYNDKKFGNVIILKDINNPNKIYIRKFIDYDSEENIKEVKQEISKRGNLGDFYSHIVSSKIEKLDKLCIKDFKLEITMEYSQSNLRNEIKKRSALNSFFTKEEIFHIFKAMVYFANSLDNLNSLEQFLGLDNVLLHPFGRVSIIETKFLLPYSDIYAKLLCLSYEPIPKEKWSILAPEQLEGIRSSNKKIGCDFSKIHSFAIGVTILCLLSCKYEYYFYDLSKFVFLEDKAASCLENSELNFETINLIKRSLHKDPKQRINSKDMLEEIDFIKKKYEIDSNLNVEMGKVINL